MSFSTACSFVRVACPHTWRLPFYCNIFVNAGRLTSEATRAIRDETVVILVPRQQPTPQLFGEAGPGFDACLPRLASLGLPVLRYLTITSTTQRSMLRQTR